MAVALPVDRPPAAPSRRRPSPKRFAVAAWRDCMIGPPYATGRDSSLLHPDAGPDRAVFSPDSTARGAAARAQIDRVAVDRSDARRLHRQVSTPMVEGIEAPDHRRRVVPAG